MNRITMNTDHRHHIIENKVEATNVIEIEATLHSMTNSENNDIIHTVNRWGKKDIKAIIITENKDKGINKIREIDSQVIEAVVPNNTEEVQDVRTEIEY